MRNEALKEKTFREGELQLSAKHEGRSDMQETSINSLKPWKKMCPISNSKASLPDRSAGSTLDLKLTFIFSHFPLFPHLVTNSKGILSQFGLPNHQFTIFRGLVSAHLSLCVWESGQCLKLRSNTCPVLVPGFHHWLSYGENTFCCWHGRTEPRAQREPDLLPRVWLFRGRLCLK